MFVHGLGSNPDTTWTAKAPGSSKDKVCWVTDFLPEDIPPQMRDDVRLYFYNYDSFWKRDAVQVELVDLGEDLLQNLRAIRRNQNVSTRKAFFLFRANEIKCQERGRHLVLIGHSYGGLIIKQVYTNPEFNTYGANGPRPSSMRIKTKNTVISLHTRRLFSF